MFISRKKEGNQIITFEILTAYPESLESYSALVGSIEMGSAFSVESVDISDRSGSREPSREWNIRLICHCPPATFEDFFGVRRDISRTSFNPRDYDDSKDLIFRIYIPCNRLYSAETDKLISLFHEWLSSTGRNDVRLDRL